MASVSSISSVSSVWSISSFQPKIESSQHIEAGRRCGTCRFFAYRWQIGKEVCRRWPPPFYAVDPDDWCGEWREKAGSGIQKGESIL